METLTKCDNAVAAIRIGNQSVLPDSLRFTATLDILFIIKV